MATFKRLTHPSEKGEKIDVNMDTVAHMQRFTSHTLLHFAAGSPLTIKETPDQIHKQSPLSQAK